MKCLTPLAALLLIGSASAKECASNVTAEALAIIDNATFLDSCAPGSTWKLPTLFDAANLSSTDFFAFCNATACMESMHKLLGELPDDCESPYHGQSVVLVDKISAFHDTCHKTLREHNATMPGMTGMTTETTTRPSAVPSPTPTLTRSGATTTCSAAVLVGAATLAASFMA